MIEQYEHLNTGDETRCPGWLRNSCYTGNSLRITPAVNPLISRDMEKEN